MSCYMRHLPWLFEALELEYDKPNRKRVDAALRSVLDLPEETACPEVWAKVKSLDEDEQAGLVPAVRAALD